MTTCTSCGCSWGDDGYYHSKGEIVQPCKECRLDARSIQYLNNREAILEQQRVAYYAKHEERKAYYRQYRREQRAQAQAV